MGLFSSIGGSISRAASNALQTTVRSVAQNALGQISSKIPGPVGAVVGGLLSGQSIGQVVQNIAGGLISSALNKIPGVAGDFFRAAFAQSGTASAFNLSGLGASRTQLKPATTRIIDRSGREVEITTDTYLQGLQGSLSSTSSNRLNSDQFGGFLGNALGGTALAAVTAAVVIPLAPKLGQAMDGFASSLGQAAGKLTGSIGAGMEKLPGVGPLVANVNKSLDSFSKNIGLGIAGVPIQGQQIMGGIVLGIGANIVGNKIKKKRIADKDAEIIRRDMEFKDNPAAQLNTIATQCHKLGTKVDGTLNDPAFSILAQDAKRASNEMSKVILRKSNGRYGFKNSITDEQLGLITKVINGNLTKVGLVDIPAKSTDSAMLSLLQASPTFAQLVANTGIDARTLHNRILLSGLSIEDYATGVYNGSIQI